MNGVLILGGGGHAKVVADILQLCGVGIQGFLDDDASAHGKIRCGLPVLGAIDDWRRFAPSGLILGIGSNAARRAIVERLEATPELWINAIHPRATIAASAKLERGLVIAAGAVVNPDAALGDHVIINTSASIDHDCAIGNYAHIAPGTHLAGAVIVEQGAFLGIGTSVIPSVKIGAWATVGAGSLILRDVPANTRAFGVPAIHRN